MKAGGQLAGVRRFRLCRVLARCRSAILGAYLPALGHAPPLLADPWKKRPGRLGDLATEDDVKPGGDSPPSPSAGGGTDSPQAPGPMSKPYQVRFWSYVQFRSETNLLRCISLSVS